MMALISTPDLSATYLKAISDLKETIMKTYGFQAQGMKITGFDSSEALMGQSVFYEFVLEIDTEAPKEDDSNNKTGNGVETTEYNDTQSYQLPKDGADYHADYLVGGECDLRIETDFTRAGEAEEHKGFGLEETKHQLAKNEQVQEDFFLDIVWMDVKIQYHDTQEPKNENVEAVLQDLF